MALKTDESSFNTHRSVTELGRALQGVLSHVKAQSISEVESTSGALAAFDDRAEIQILAQGQSLLGGQWAVQVYVFDRGEHREVILVALGDGGFARAFNGARNTLSLGGSVKKRDEIGSLLNQ